MQSFKFPRRTIVITVILAMAASKTAAADVPALQLDTTWGGTGIVQTQIDATQGVDTIKSILVQADGKVVAVGRHLVYGNGGTTSSTIAVARYNLDGTLDATFANGGREFIPPPDPSLSEDPVSAILLPNGQIVVSSSVTNNGPSGISGSTVRLNTDGSVDGSFQGDWGKRSFQTQPGPWQVFFDEIYSPRNWIVECGPAFCNGYRPDGSSNPSLNFQLYLPNAQFALQPNGNIVYAYTQPFSNGDSRTTVILGRTNPDGSPDRSWGTGGLVTPTSDSYRLLNLTSRDDGVIVVNVSGFGSPNVGATFEVYSDSTTSAKRPYATISASNSLMAVHPDHRIVMGNLGAGNPDVLLLDERGAQSAAWTSNSQCTATAFGFGPGRIYAACAGSPFITVALGDPKGTVSTDSKGIDASRPARSHR